VCITLQVCDNIMVTIFVAHDIQPVVSTDLFIIKARPI